MWEGEAEFWGGGEVGWRGKRQKWEVRRSMVKEKPKT